MQRRSSSEVNDDETCGSAPFPCRARRMSWRAGGPAQRANVLEGNVRLYHVKDRRRMQLASWSGAVTGNCHELRVDAREDRIQVFWDGSQIIDTTDRTFTEPGKVGVWTKADSVTYFDDFTIVPL